MLSVLTQQKICQEELEKWKVLEKEAQEKLDNESKDLTKVSTKQNMLRQKLDECQSKISDLGALPNTELITKYMSYSSKNVSILYYSFVAFHIFIDNRVFFILFFSCLKNLKRLTVILNVMVMLTKRLQTNLLVFQNKKKNWYPENKNLIEGNY